MAVCFLFCFLLLFVCRSSVTAEEEQMFDGNQTLETMVRMETKIIMAELEENVLSILEDYREEMDELRTQNGKIKRKNALLKKRVSILEDRREEMDEEFQKQNGTLATLIADFNDVRDDVRNITADMEIVADTPKVAFNAYTTAKGSYTNDDVIIFPKVILNEGGGYNSSTGVFTAPISGLYQFHVHICHQPGYYMAVSIEHGNETLAKTKEFENVGSSCSSVTVPALVNVDENVFIKSQHQNSRLYADASYRWPSFSGFLVHE